MVMFRLSTKQKPYALQYDLRNELISAARVLACSSFVGSTEDMNMSFVPRLLAFTAVSIRVQAMSSEWSSLELLPRRSLVPPWMTTPFGFLFRPISE